MLQQLWIFSRDYLVGIGKELRRSRVFIGLHSFSTKQGEQRTNELCFPNKDDSGNLPFSELRGLLGILGKPPSRINHELYHRNINYISQPLVVLMDHLLYSYLFWLVVWNMAFMTFHIFGMSSSQQTNIFQRG